MARLQHQRGRQSAGTGSLGSRPGDRGARARRASADGGRRGPRHRIQPVHRSIGPGQDPEVPGPARSRLRQESLRSRLQPQARR